MKVANLTASGALAQQGQERDGDNRAFQKCAISSLTHRTRLSRLKKKIFGYSQPGFHKVTTKHTTCVWFVKDFSPLFDSKDFYMCKAKC